MVLSWQGAAPAEEPIGPADPVDYATQVKPLLESRCASCHGALKQEASLRLDAASLIARGGDSGPAVVAGSSGDSLLILAIQGADGLTPMPLDGAPLSADEVALLKRWIDQGAVAPDEPIPPSPREHWSFQPPLRPAIPDIDEDAAATVLNPIDAFIAAQHQSKGLTPLGPAPPHVLLRRLYLDLTGLPPTPEELRAFLNDPSDAAYQETVDRLLASPHYGERWGRHWMDIWRYSDWAGYQQEIRNSQRHIWRWRDWIIESLNADKGYDQMILEMLAGDELAPADPDVVRATGYLARNWFKFNRHVWLDTTVEHTAKGFLGLTFNCARCHDHRYDPIEQADYYRFRAFFEAHQVRTDRVPGQADVMQDGLPRVYDDDASAPTYLFVRGDEMQPDKDHPLEPGLPEIFTFEPASVAPVALPVESYYPGIRDYVRREAHEQAVLEARSRHDERVAAMAARDAAQQQVDKLTALAEAAQTGATPQEPAATAAAAAPAPEPAELPAAQAQLADAALRAQQLELQAGAAEANLLAVDARLAADQARFATPPQADAETLALAAGRAERQAGVWSIELELWSAELDLKAAQAAAEPDDPARGGTLQGKIDAFRKAHGNADAAAKGVVERQAKLETLRQKLVEAQQSARQSSTAYSALDTVYPAHSTGRRLALARWIASGDNPLTARVAINHIWLRHFGEPLVATVFDFGMRGQRPTHPVLLDWLAVELVDSGWSMKHVHRLIVTSAAYRRASGPVEPHERALAAQNAALDQDNRFLWRMNPRRMESEAVRDSLLAVAGQLDGAMGGPEMDHDAWLDSKRRSIYFRHASEKQVLFLKLFDTASVTECYRRTESIVPQQGLALANSPLAVAQARRAAERLTQEAGDGDDADDYVRRAFALILTRAPSDAELAECVAFLDEQATAAGSDSESTESAVPAEQQAGAETTTAASKTAETKSGEIPAPSDDPRQRARENLLLVLINHHDFVTIR